MAKQITKVFAIEAYDTEETNDPKTGAYKDTRVKRASRQLLDTDGVVTDDAEAIGFFASEKAAKTTIKEQFGGPKDDKFKAAEPAVVVFTRE